jgi:hypothetical protein
MLFTLFFFYMNFHWCLGIFGTLLPSWWRCDLSSWNVCLVSCLCRLFVFLQDIIGSLA